MKRVIIGLIVSFLIMGLVSGAGAVSLFKEVDAKLQKRLVGAKQDLCRSGLKGCVRQSQELNRFYEKREYVPAWTDDYGLLPQAEDLLDVVRHAEAEGLRPNDYYLKEIDKILHRIPARPQKQKLLQPETLVDLEILLTNAFFKYANHLIHGKLDPSQFHPLWRMNRLNPDLSEELEQAIENGRVKRLLRRLIPHQKAYRELKQALLHYRKIKQRGGWPLIAEGPVLRIGDHSRRIAVLRRRLAVTGDGRSKNVRDIAFFDTGLKRAVRHFQSRHGLSPDGIVGQATLAVLNVPVDQQIHRLEINMERWRWLSAGIAADCLLVDIAGYSLYIYEKGRQVNSMGVIVGEPHRQTPVMTDHITDVVINPYWYVPQSIIIQDIIPKYRQNPDYLKALHIGIYQQVNGVTSEIDPRSIDWDTFDEKQSKYQFRQEPGPGNFLGHFKFIMSNDVDIYLHDTPFRKLFSIYFRDLSSGCIRVEKPDYLAAYLLRHEDGWTPEKIAVIESIGGPRRIGLTIPFPIYVMYWTARVDASGTVQFRPDVYKMDPPLLKAMAAR